MRAALVFCILALIVYTVVGNTILPAPRSVKYTGDYYPIDRTRFSFEASGFQHEILNNAFIRYHQIIFRGVMAQKSNRFGLNTPSAPAPGEITTCQVHVASSDVELNEKMDETYSMDTTQAGLCMIKANSVWGALRALESFSQLVKNGNEVTAAAVEDAPRFNYRGFMIDTSRHYYPLNVIYQHLDAMAYAKMNVLHWHIVDDQSFPYQSSRYPILSKDGAFSPSHIYTQTDVRRVIAYAYERGIRVIPEFDTPGHVTKGYRALEPKILTDCYNSKGVAYKTGPLNPTLNATYEFLSNFYDELKEVFVDQFVHIGGDEVIQSCWKSNPQITEWMKQRNMTSYNELEHYFVRNLLDMLAAKGKSYMVWQEVFARDGENIQPDTLVEVWDVRNWKTIIPKVVAKNLRTVISAPYYLNFIHYGQDWKDLYVIEPTDFEGGPEGEAKGLIAGLEACMWSEFVDATNFIARSWPRAAIVAERAWSPKEYNTIEGFQERLHEYRCKLVSRGIDAQPSENGADINTLDGKTFCPDEWNPRYSPPWL